MNRRSTEVLRNGLWAECEFENLKVTDIFRLFEPNGELVIGPKGASVFICTSDAYIGEEGIWMVDIKE